MFKFRGQRKDGKYVIGYLTKGVDEYYIEDISTHDEMIFPTVVSKNSLSISTGELDSNGVEIFASFPIDGTMTGGGDVVRIKGYNNRLYVQFDLRTCGFVVIDVATDTVIWRAGVLSENFTIIGKQGGQQWQMKK